MDVEEARTSGALEEVDFLAENTLVGIQASRRTGEAWELASVSVERFRMYERREVPLWMAQVLERKGQATVERPAWLETETLRGLIREERKLTMETLGVLPCEFFESLAKKLLRPDCEEAVLVQDLLAIRRAKILATIKGIDIRFVHANVSTWSAMERAMFRPGALGLLEKINHAVTLATADAASAANSQLSTAGGGRPSFVSVSQHSG